MTDIQYDFKVLNMFNKNITLTDENEETLNEWPLREFYVYEISIKNIRIKS